MRVLTYNILYGGVDERGSRLPLIQQAVKALNPDVITIQEADNFDSNDNLLLRRFAECIGCEYNDISLYSGAQSKSGKKFHVATFSKLPFSKTSDFQGRFRNAALETVVETSIGAISICNAHLNPFSEDERLKEIEMLLEEQAQYKNRVILGDLNSLSGEDSYSPELIKGFNEKQLKKFTQDGRLRCGVTSKLKELHYVDVAVLAGINQVKTVPTQSNVDAAHETPMRLDYIFVSQSIVPYVRNVEVVKNATTDKASDHYPLMVDLEI